MEIESLRPNFKKKKSESSKLQRVVNQTGAVIETTNFPCIQTHHSGTTGPQDQ